MIHLDTSFVIDLLREIAQRRSGAAVELIESFDQREILGVSVHVACELRAGAELARKALVEQEEVDRLLSGLLVTYPDDRFPVTYGRLLAGVQRSGRRIASRDLLIATAAIVDDAPLVTRHVAEFSRVPGLRVLGY